jgi:hypothetical protein
MSGVSTGTVTRAHGQECCSGVPGVSVPGQVISKQQCHRLLFNTILHYNGIYSVHATRTHASAAFCGSLSRSSTEQPTDTTRTGSG